MYRKFTYGLAALVLSLGVFLGFSISEDPHSARGNFTSQGESNGQTYFSPNSVIKYVDSLNGNNDTTALKSRGYVVKRGPNAGPPGLTALWFQGSTPFPAFNGPATGYVAANYNATTGANNIDNWLILPAYNSSAGDSLGFYSRAPAASTFPDSIRVMYSAAGDTMPTGSWTELGRFKVNTAGTWEQRFFVAPTAGPNARFAIRYCVVNGGPSGANSDYIGIDMITIQGTQVQTSCNYTYGPQTSGTTSTLYSVSSVNDMIAWAAGVGATVRRTTDGGSTWGNGNSNPGVISGDVYNIYAVDANTAFVTTSPSATFIYKTTNGGANWTQVYTLAGGFINAIEMNSPLTGFAEGDPVGGTWTILSTADGGNTWTRMATEPPQAGSEAGWNNSFQVMGTNIWFGTNNTRVYRSNNLGLTWTFGATTGTLNTYGLHFNSATNGFAGGNAGVYSTDGGATWVASTVPGTGNISGGVAGGNNDMFVCRGSNIYRSTNNGATWNTTAVYTAAGTLWDMDMKVVGGCPTGWAVGASGAIAKVTGMLVGVSNVGSEIPSSYMLKQNFPNPFNPTTNIQFSLPESGFVTLKVFDIAGREVKTLVNEFKTAGSYIVDFNATNLSSGAYFYRIESGKFADTKKMMLIK